MGAAVGKKPLAPPRLARLRQLYMSREQYRKGTLDQQERPVQPGVQIVVICTVFVTWTVGVSPDSRDPPDPAYLREGIPRPQGGQLRMPPHRSTTGEPG